MTDSLLPFSTRSEIETALRQALGLERHAEPFMSENLARRPALAPKHIQIASMDVFLKAR
jgi:hypothetical protein